MSSGIVQDISSVPAGAENKRAQRLDLIMKLMEARIQARFDVLEVIALPDVVVRIIGDSAFSPFAGTFKGRQAARAALERLSVEFEYTQVNVEYIMVDGDQVALRWRGELRNRGTSARGEFEGFLHIVFRDDLVSEYVAYVDTAALARLAD